MVHFLTSFFFIIAMSSCSPSYGEDSPLLCDEKSSTTPDQKQESLCDETSFIKFEYKDIELVNVINTIAALKKVNIVLPQGKDVISTKLSISIDHLFNPDEAWIFLNTLLEMSGYRIVLRGSLYKIVKNSNTLVKEPLRILVNTPVNEIPKSDEFIHYIYFLAHAKLEGDTDGGEIDAILKAMLPENSPYTRDQASNAILITAPANAIAGLLPLLQQVDQAIFEEKVDHLVLHFHDATIVANLFNNNLLALAQDQQSSRLRPDTRKHQEATYFSKRVRIVPVPSKNMLIMVGKAQDIERIRNFITEYLDKPPESGKSVLHTHKLQYIDATELKRALDAIIQSSTGGSGQSKTEGTVGGPERFFGEVIIETDKPKNSGSPTSGLFQGGNNLIIACRNDDWKRLKPLIEKLDIASPQVLISILIADISLDDSRALGSMLRNPSKFPLPAGMAFQSAQLDPGVIPNSFSNPQTIGYIERPQPQDDDLLRLILNSAGSRTDTGAVASLLGAAPAGTAAISFNDSTGKTWGVLEVLKLFDYTKIITAPHVIATHNKQTLIERGEQRKVQGNVVTNNVSPTVQVIDITANLSVRITPRISSAEVVNLQVEIAIDDFRGVNNTIVTRRVTTNANIHSGSVLVLGGFLRTNDETGVRETPLLSRVPILGYFFKRRTNELMKTNVTVFITPTIIFPRVHKGINEYTTDQINLTKAYGEQSELSNQTNEPITRLFFQLGSSVSDALDDFTSFEVDSHIEPNDDYGALPSGRPLQEKYSHDDFDKNAALAKIKEEITLAQVNPLENHTMH